MALTNNRTPQSRRGQRKARIEDKIKRINAMHSKPKPKPKPAGGRRGKGK